MTTHRNWLYRSVHLAVRGITDGLKAVIEIVEGLGGRYANGQWLPLLLLFNKGLSFFVQIWFLYNSCTLPVVISSQKNVLIIDHFPPPLLMAVVSCHFISCILWCSVRFRGVITSGGASLKIKGPSFEQMMDVEHFMYSSDFAGGSELIRIFSCVYNTARYFILLFLSAWLCWI